MTLILNTAIFESEIKKGESQFTCIKKYLNDSILKKINGIEFRMEYFPQDYHQMKNELHTIKTYLNKYNYVYMLSIPEQLYSNNILNVSLLSEIKKIQELSFDSIKVSCGDLNEITKEDKAQLIKITEHINLTIENQPNSFGKQHLIEDSLKKIKESNLPIGYTFDSGNWYWISEDPEEALYRLKNYITFFHLKSILNKDCRLLSDNDSSIWKNLITQLDSEIPVVLEYPIPPRYIEDEVHIIKSYLN